MNLLKFLEQVDHETEGMSKSDLAEFVHDMARKLPESGRSDFLRRLKGMQERGETRTNKAKKDCGITEKLAGIRKELECIVNGELCLEGSLNEEYDDWYCSMDEEFLYEDPEGVVDVLTDACDFVHQCIDCEEYKAGYEIAEILIGLEITVDGEYQEYTEEPVRMDELEVYHLGGPDYKSFVMDALCVAYCANPLEERPGALYRIIINSRQGDITLERVMQRGYELPETDAFIPLWISYLGQLTTGTARRLLKEALELTNDPGELLENARKYHAQHPELYEQYLLNEMDKGEAEALFAAGREALENIAPEYTVRSRIALLMSRIALRNGMDGVEICWLEAFRSDTRVVNYLRLITECQDLSRVRPDIEQICSKTRGQAGKNTYFYVQERPERMNQVNPVTVYMLAFLEGEFQYVKENGMNVKSSLGWSATFMKCGMAAFLLLLTESDTLLAGGKSMCHMVVASTGFDKEDYEKGILETITDSNEEWFWKCICRWKETVHLSEEEKENYLQWVEELVTKRVTGIMENNRRNYYGECAAYAAALGEAKESRGEIGGKQRTMLGYKEMYSRRSAFHAELRAFGMKDGKKR